MLLHLVLMRMAEDFGVERIGMLTLTFKDLVLCAREAQRRLNSLLTGVIRERYDAYVTIIERCKSGRIHFHILLALREDIQTGYRHADGKGTHYHTASPHLRSEWAFWRKTAPLYRFGRTELLPIKSNGEGIARYVGKYVSKHIGARIEGDKGVRLVRHSRDRRVGTTRFAFNSTRSWLWRAKLKQFAMKKGCSEYDDLQRVLGKKWAFLYAPCIMMEELKYWPTREHAIADGQWWANDLEEGAVDIRLGDDSARCAFRTARPEDGTGAERNCGTE